MLTAGCFPIKDANKLGTKIAIIIPARMDSKRLPNKVLLELAGLPMLEHVRRRGMMNKYSVPVFVTSGDKLILDIVQQFGGLGIKSNREHTDGLSRVSEAATQLNHEFFIILQADEILALPTEIDSLIEAISASPDVNAWNQTTSLLEVGELEDINVVKCLRDSSGHIISLFRKSPLTSQIAVQMELVSKICGLFAVSKDVLEIVSKKNIGKLQVSESIEQLKFIENGYRIKSLYTNFNFPSVNVREDFIKVESILEKSLVQSEILSEVLSFTA
jgi:3-deoxy-manno-octulosonate cytidylyltransferase (CMP-KDO synthetase)